MKPARQVITRSPHRLVGAVHASWFQSEPIHHESFLEKACIEILLLMPMAEHIQFQPMTLDYVLDGHELSYTPDFRVRLKDGRDIIIEVKPEVFLEEHRQKFDACAKRLAEAEVEYYVCTDAWLTVERVNRAEELRDYARRAAPSNELAALMQAARSVGRLSVKDVLAQGISQQVIGHAVGRRLLTLGPSLDISPSNWLSLMDLEDEYLRCSDWIGSAPWGTHLAI